MNELCEFNVKEAINGDRLLPGKVFIAPGGKQMKVKNAGGTMTLEITDDPPVNQFYPSVDYLFSSVKDAKSRRPQLHIIAALLTGMGADDANGLHELRGVGAETIAQDEETSFVFGMPREAINRGAAKHVVPLDQIARIMAKLMAGSDDLPPILATGQPPNTCKIFLPGRDSQSMQKHLLWHQCSGSDVLPHRDFTLCLKA